MPGRRRSGAGPARGARALVALCLVVVGAWAGPTTTAVADGGHAHRTRDHVGVRGFDLDTDVTADVSARSAGNNLTVDVVAGTPLVDGTVVVSLPDRSWPTDLHPATLLDRADPGLAGSVVVRPLPWPLVGPSPQPVPVPVGGGRPPVDPPGTTDGPYCATYDTLTTVGTANTAHRHVVTVQHVWCRAGQLVSVHIAGVEAPKRPGRYRIATTVSDARGHRSAQQPRIRVDHRVTTRLTVDVPAATVIGEPYTVTVRALRPDGRVDRRMSGEVRFVTQGSTCDLDPAYAPRVTFTPADAGIKVVTLTQEFSGSTRLLVESVQRRAIATTSPPIDVTARTPEDEPPCSGSVSYH